MDHNDYRIIYLEQNGRCFYCDRAIQPRPFTEKRKNGWTRDHFVPVAVGAKRLHNIVLTCHDCNNSKKARMPTQPEIDRFYDLLSRVQDRISVEKPTNGGN